jgi:AraC-like DNA-binding protein/quercetin dioxygenase-like cupin family protein
MAKQTKQLTLTRIPESPPVVNPDEARGSAFVLTQWYDTSPGEWHSHRRAQLIHASEGVLTVHAEQGMWVVPPQRAVWIASGTTHKVSSIKPFALRSLYLSARSHHAPNSCKVVTVTPLLDELMAHAAKFGLQGPHDAAGLRLLRVLLDQLPTLQPIASYLPRPLDARLQRLVAALERNPADASTLGRLAADCGMTGRTAARLFMVQTGLTFGQWRLQLRLLHAMMRLAEGASVTQVAGDVGYEDVSAFIAVYKRAFGETPGKAKKNH